MKIKKSKLEIKNIEIEYNKPHNEVIKAYMSIRLNKIKLGKYFYLLKKKVGHGNFVNIIETEYTFLSIRTVQNYITSYKKNLELEEA